MSSKILAQILLPLPFNHGFSYFVPENLILDVGDIVKVPFRRKEIYGVVVGFDDNEDIDPKKIKTILEKTPDLKLSPQLLEFIRWVSNYNLAPQGLVLKLAIAILNHDKKTKPRKTLPQPAPININLKPLASDQQQAADFLAARIAEKKYSTTLINGITGSGKTEVYFSAIAKILVEERNGQVLILLPEIALTSQISNRFKEQFGFAPDLWHSKISPSKKQQLFSNIADGSSRVIIGARSALFLPFKNLQLIVVDEEHDPSFKQEDIVNYHGRDMAIIRTKIENIPIVLVSATPAIETYLNAQNGKYHLLKLQQRFGQEQHTKITVLDMRKEKLEKDQFISAELKLTLRDNLESGKQSLLFLNRRGYAPLTLCKACGHKVTCNNCSSYITYHQKINKLICHHCGFTKKLINLCPHCHNKDCLITFGVGVEKIKEEVSSYFPEARILMITSDTVKSINDAEKLLKQIIDHQIDIVIGTQMIAKGHHFPSLALVGIIDGDSSFNSGSLRTLERSYQLLTQVIGRAGREHYQGQVILQTYNPDNLIFKNIIENNQEQFLQNEIASRKALNFPPFSKMAAIIFSGLNENSVINFAKLTLSKCAEQINDHNSIELFGPAPMPIAKIKNRYYYRLTIKVDKKISLQKFITQVLGSVPTSPQIRMKIDIDPI